MVHVCLVCWTPEDIRLPRGTLHTPAALFCIDFFSVGVFENLVAYFPMKMKYFTWDSVVSVWVAPENLRCLPHLVTLVSKFPAKPTR